MGSTVAPRQELELSVVLQVCQQCRCGALNAYPKCLTIVQAPSALEQPDEHSRTQQRVTGSFRHAAYNRPGTQSRSVPQPRHRARAARARFPPGLHRPLSANLRYRTRGVDGGDDKRYASLEEPQDGHKLFLRFDPVAFWWFSTFELPLVLS